MAIQEYQYMIQVIPMDRVELDEVETHLVDAMTDEQAKAKLAILLNFKVDIKDMVIFDKYPVGE